LVVAYYESYMAVAETGRKHFFDRCNKHNLIFNDLRWRTW